MATTRPKTPLDRRERTGRRALLAGVVTAAVALFAVVALLALGGGDSSTGGGYKADPKNFDLPALTGEGNVRLADHKGKPVVVNFFASWCVYCKKELPSFVQVAKATRGQIDFIGVQSQDQGDGVGTAKLFGLEEAGFTLAKDIGSEPASDLWRASGGQGMPITVFYDASGKRVHTSPGMLTQEALTQMIQQKFGITVKAEDAAGLQAPVIPLIPLGAHELIQKQTADDPVIVVDTRAPAAFAAGHLEGAINVNAAGDVAAALAPLSKDTSYIVYGQDGKDSAPLTATMHDQGFKHLYEIEGGLDAWAKAGGPTVR